MNKLFTVAIIGRPNVGKSTLFNRLFGRRRALVHNYSGVTRDRLALETELYGHPLRLIDTGGIGGEILNEEITRQVELAIQESDLALLVLDGQTGVSPLDEEVVRQVRQMGLEREVPVIAVVNKVDSDKGEDAVPDFYRLGFENIFSLSAEHDRGVGDLKEEIIKRIKDLGVENVLPVSEEAPFEKAEAKPDLDAPPKRRVPRVAVVGKPNVGKSTFLNALLGERRMITSPMAGTTIDSIDSKVILGGKEYLFIDTAGIRRKAKTDQGVEVLSVVQAKKALERADLAVLVLDGEKGIAEQDEKIANLILRAGCSVVLAMNKWDTQRKNPNFSQEDAAERIRKNMRFLEYAPVFFMSAKEGKGFENLGELIDDILHQRRIKLSTNEFTTYIRTESEIHNPKNARFFLCHQTSQNPPTFVCHVNDPKKIHFSLSRHLVKGMRQRWGFMGSPVRLKFQKRDSHVGRSW